MQAAIDALAHAAPPDTEILLFGSHARGDTQAESDLDFLVIEPMVDNRSLEMVRLRRSLRPLRVAAEPRYGLPGIQGLDRPLVRQAVAALLHWASGQLAGPR